MSAFTIRDIENLCGIKAHTLRVWEQRYRFLSPKRKAGNHRLYDNEDLKYLLRIAFLYHQGHKISELARLTGEEISRLALKIPQPGGADEIFINHLVEASLDFDQDGFERVLHSVILHMGFEKAITKVVYPFLTKIGLLWLTGNIIPAQEHFASGLILKKLMAAIDGLEMPPVPGPDQAIILLYTPEGEFHEIPLLYMYYLMKKNTLATVYFGVNTSLAELKDYCARRPVTHLYFHLVTNLLRCEPNQYLVGLLEAFPQKKIVFSGSPGLNMPEYPPRACHLRNAAEMEAFATGKLENPRE